MARSKARFRISLKDNLTGRSLKVELIEQPWPGRYWLRQQGKNAERISEASVSTVFARLRRWLVQQARPARKRAGG
jgi:hypothetical protein